MIVRRLVGSTPALSLRAHSHYGGEHALAGRARVIPPHVLHRPALYRWALDSTTGVRPRWILCVPLTDEELTVAIALRDTHNARLCLYLMDDANVETTGISDAQMAEAIDKATMRLAISSDLRDAYQAKYGRHFWLLPPTGTSMPRAGGGWTCRPKSSRPGACVCTRRSRRRSWSSGWRATRSRCCRARRPARPRTAAWRRSACPRASR